MTASTTLIRIMSVLGMLLSAYALYVEHRKAEDELYVAACDINSWVACSKCAAPTRPAQAGAACSH